MADRGHQTQTYYKPNVRVYSYPAAVRVVSVRLNFRHFLYKKEVLSIISSSSYLKIEFKIKMSIHAHPFNQL